MTHTDHTAIIQGPFETDSDVTRACCLECHEDAAFEVMQTVHRTWESRLYDLESRDEIITVGKKNAINNFCLGIQGNWAGCTSCHAGYGWDDANFDFSNPENVDCLVCHDNSGVYVKGPAGVPVEMIVVTDALRVKSVVEDSPVSALRFTKLASTPVSVALSSENVNSALFSAVKAA